MLPFSYFSVAADIWPHRLQVPGLEGGDEGLLKLPTAPPQPHKDFLFKGSHCISCSQAIPNTPLHLLQPSVHPARPRRCSSCSSSQMSLNGRDLQKGPYREERGPHSEACRPNATCLANSLSSLFLRVSDLCFVTRPSSCVFTSSVQ